MIRLTTLLWVALLVVAGGTVMHVSYQVRHVEKHLSELARDTRQEEDAIRILGAEWDSLNDPHRIDELAKRHLALESTPIARVVALEAIPLKLSDEQVAKLSTASAVKTPKGQTPAPVVVAKKPEILVNATNRDLPARAAQPAPSQVSTVVARTTPAPQQRDDVGLILARMERRE
jgi:cell division protein FtsL